MNCVQKTAHNLTQKIGDLILARALHVFTQQHHSKGMLEPAPDTPRIALSMSQMLIHTCVVDASAGSWVDIRSTQNIRGRVLEKRQGTHTTRMQPKRLAAASAVVTLEHLTRTMPRTLDPNSPTFQADSSQCKSKQRRGTPHSSQRFACGASRSA